MAGTRFEFAGRSQELSGEQISAPVLGWITDAKDRSPQFTVDLDASTQDGDVLHLQWAREESFTHSTEGTISLGRKSIMEAEAALGLSPLPEGQSYVRVRIERAGQSSPWSNAQPLFIQ